MSPSSIRLLKVATLILLAAAIGAGAGWLLPTAYQKLRGTSAAATYVRSGDYSLYFAGRGEPIIVFSTSWCPVCRATRHFLDQQGVAYFDMDIETDARHAALYATLGVDVIPVIMMHDKMLPGSDESTLHDWIVGLKQKGNADAPVSRNN